MNVYIISLASAVERQQFQKKQFKKIGINYTIIKAIEFINDKIYKKHYYDWQRPLKKTELSCYLSHQTAWQKVLTENKPALILEDDIILSKYVADVLHQCNKYKQFDLINFEVCFRKKYVAKYSEKINDTHQLVQLYLNRSGAGAYVLYPSGAKKLLQFKKKGIALADYFIHNCYNLKSYQVEPALAIQMIFAKRYKLKTQYLNFCMSFIFDGTRPKSNYLFKCKRIIGQLRLGIRQLAITTKSIKREIFLNPDHFNME